VTPLFLSVNDRSFAGTLSAPRKVPQQAAGGGENLPHTRMVIPHSTPTLEVFLQGLRDAEEQQVATRRLEVQKLFCAKKVSVYFICVSRDLCDSLTVATLVGVSAFCYDIYPCFSLRSLSLCSLTVATLLF
jgi:hypothetical protein